LDTKDFSDAFASANYDISRGVFDMVVAVACKRDFLNNLGGEMTGKVVQGTLQYNYPLKQRYCKSTPD